MIRYIFVRDRLAEYGPDLRLDYAQAAAENRLTRVDLVELALFKGALAAAEHPPKDDSHT